MDLNLFNMLSNSFSYIFNSFSTIFIFILFLVMITLSILNLKFKNRFVDYILIGVYIGTLFGIFISNYESIFYLFNEFCKFLIKFYYFTPPLLYIISILFIIIINIYTIYSTKENNVYKIFIYIFCNFIYFFFFLFLIVVTKNNINLKITNMLYSNELIVSFVRVSNLIFIFLIIFIIFHKLYVYLFNKDI